MGGTLPLASVEVRSGCGHPLR